MPQGHSKTALGGWKSRNSKGGFAPTAALKGSRPRSSTAAQVRLPLLQGWTACQIVLHDKYRALSKPWPQLTTYICLEAMGRQAVYPAQALWKCTQQSLAFMPALLARADTRPRQLSDAADYRPEARLWWCPCQSGWCLRPKHLCAGPASAEPAPGAATGRLWGQAAGQPLWGAATGQPLWGAATGQPLWRQPGRRWLGCTGHWAGQRGARQPL